MTETSLALPLTMTRDLKLMRLFFRFMETITPSAAGAVAARLFLTPRARPISRRAQEIMGQARQERLAHGSRELAIYVWGDEGPTVLLVHGWESNASGMRGFVRPLRRAGFRVVAFDAPAHGGSTGRQTNLIDYGGALQNVMRAYGPIHGIIAHSFGAATTLYTLSRAPELQVNGIVSIAAPSRLMDMFHAWTGFLGISPATAQRMMGRLIDRVGIPIDTLQVETAVLNVNVPGLIVHDRQDTIAAYNNAEAIAANWPAARLMTTDGLDHRGPLQDRTVIKEALAFLASADLVH